jgi:hypothetical protein
MKRDIDDIISLLRERFPALKVVQMHKTHPADDDGLWWFRLPGVTKDIQVESSTGNCPLIIESSDDRSAVDARTGRSVDEVVEIVSRYLQSLAPDQRRS